MHPYGLCPPGSAWQSDRYAGLHHSPEQTGAAVTFPATMAHCGAHSPAHRIVSLLGQTPGQQPLLAQAFESSRGHLEAPRSCLCGQSRKWEVILTPSVWGPLLCWPCWEEPQLHPWQTLSSPQFPWGTTLPPTHRGLHPLPLLLIEGGREGPGVAARSWVGLGEEWGSGRPGLGLLVARMPFSSVRTKTVVVTVLGFVPLDSHTSSGIAPSFPGETEAQVEGTSLAMQ